MSNHLTVYFSLQVKNQPNDEIAFSVFIFGAGLVMNSCQTAWGRLV
jgi:hypothetical protein